MDIDGCINQMGLKEHRFWKGLFSQCTRVRANGSQIPRRPPSLTASGFYVMFSRASCIVTTNRDRSVLITIITWHFEVHLVIASILHLEYEFVAPSGNRFACYPHFYVTWCPLTMGFVASQCPSPSDVELVMRYLAHLISNYLKPLKIIPQP